MDYARVPPIQICEGCLVAGTCPTHEIGVLGRVPGRKSGDRHRLADTQLAPEGELHLPEDAALPGALTAG